MRYHGPLKKGTLITEDEYLRKKSRKKTNEGQAEFQKEKALPWEANRTSKRRG